MNATVHSMKRLCDIGVTLFDCEHKTPKPAPVGYPYIAIPNIQDGRLDLSDVRLITEKDWKTWTRKTKPQVGDIIVTRRGRVGDTATVPSGLQCALGQNLVILRSDGSQIDQSYLRWALRGPLYRQQVQKYLNVGAVFDSLNCADIPKFEIPVPPKPEQRAIAHILGTLDDKIELNHQMNHTLEAIARAIFKSWFVDFDPVWAKLDGERPYGMDAETAALFPDAFVESELGAIPEGWRVVKVGKLATLSRDSINPGDFPDEVFDHYSIPAFAEGRQPKADIGAEIKSNKYIVCPNSVLLSKLNPHHMHRVWLPTLSDAHRSICSTEYLVMLPQANMSCEYLYALFSSCSFLETFVGLVTGTSSSHQRVKPNDCLEIRAVIPPRSLVVSFTNIAGPLYKKAAQNIEESRTLAQLRDTLLPKLISGQLRVPDAETIPSEVVT